MPKSIVRERARDVKPPEPKELEAFVRMVLRTMKGRGELFGDESDAFQWGALAVWEGVVLRGVGLENRAYHFTAARLKIIYQARRAQCAASVYDRYARQAPIGWAKMAGCGFQVDPDDPNGAIEIPGGASPAARREAIDEARARAEVFRVARKHVAAETPRARQALEIALQRDSDTPMGDAAWLTGIAVREVNAAIGRVRKRVQEDKAAVRARRRLAELAA